MKSSITHETSFMVRPNWLQPLQNNGLQSDDTERGVSTGQPPSVMQAIAHSLRRLLVHSCIFSYILIILLWFQAQLLCLPVQAENWVMVAKSDTSQEQQYVDADSIESRGSIMRLNSYWGFLDQPDSVHYATTEYRCQSEEYRDIKVDGHPTGDEWKPVGKDLLNRAAMIYGCTHEKTDQAKN